MALECSLKPQACLEVTAGRSCMVFWTALLHCVGLQKGTTFRNACFLLMKGLQLVRGIGRVRTACQSNIRPGKLPRLQV